MLFGFLSSVCASLGAQGDSVADSSLHAARLRGEWTFALRVAAGPQTCSPPRLEGASAQTTVTISDSIGRDGFGGRRGLKGSSKLRWDWLGRAPFPNEGRFHITWLNDSTVSFTIDYFMTHNGGMYGSGRWYGDSIVGTWEQAGYCPTPSGPFALRRAGRGQD